MVNAGQVQANLNELDKVVKSQAATIAKLTTDIVQLQSGSLSETNMEELVKFVRTQIIEELDTKLETLKQDCYEKLARLKSDIKITIESEANATVRVVNSFFKTLDEKVTGHTVNIDILDEAKSKQKIAIDNLQHQLNQWANSSKAPKTDSVQNHRIVVPLPDSSDSGKNVSLKSLEARLDKLEDHSRRDNLLFTGFEEEEKENCENKVRDLLARKVFHGEQDVNINNIIIVRAHRLGPLKAGNVRPIIVKFREYSDKQMILQQVFKGKLINTGKWATEDFSVNTTNDRKYLRNHLTAAKEVLGNKIKTSSIRYKSIHVNNNNGTRFVFPLHKVVRNPQTWWKAINGSRWQERDTQQYPEGASRPEDIRDFVEEAPAEDVEQDSSGTQDSVEQPKEVAVPTGTAEDGNAP